MPVKRTGGLSGKLKRLTSEMERDVGAAVYVVAGLVETAAALSITAGAVSGRGHQPSAPGQPPNADTHGLDRSIHVEKIGPLVARVVADAPYAAIQELGGTAGGVTLPERPYMRPAAAKNRESGKKLMTAAVDRVLKGGTIT